MAAVTAEALGGLLDVLHVRKGIIEQVLRHNFVTDAGVAERLRDRCRYFICALVITSRQLETDQQIAGDVHLAVVEFQRIICQLEERFNHFEEEQLHFVCPIQREGRGRPKLVIPKEQLEGLRSLGFSWTGISKMLGVSERTIRRRREDFDIFCTGETFSEIEDDQIDRHVESILRTSPNSGERMIMGWFRGQGLHVQRWRVREAVFRVDPIGRELRRRTVRRRRVYSVPTPNALWHLDGHHKLIRWRIVIHGGIDGFSRAVVYLKASTNNEAGTVLQLFQSATEVFHYPRRIRTDYGTENVDVARRMLDKYGVELNPVLTGQSVHNQRIERLWRDVHNYIVLYFKNIFYYLETNDLLDPSNEIDIFALHYIFLPRINRAIDQFVIQWNNHPLSTERGYTPLQKWTEGFYRFAESDFATVREVLNPTEMDAYFGVDDGPLPEIQTVNHVEVPVCTTQLTEHEQTILDSVDALFDDNEYGIIAYETANRVLREIISLR